MNSLISSALAVGLLGSLAAGAGTAPSIEEFAARPYIEHVTISPDGATSSCVSFCSAAATPCCR
jgi:hypothetical protein